MINRKLTPIHALRMRTIGILLALVVLMGCSAEKKNFFSKAYHNTTAYFNAYFIAKEHTEEIERSIWENHQDNYNDILHVLPEIDTNFTSSLEDKIEDIIIKASLPIQRHGNSDWVDDSYILIGKARLFSGNYVDAIETFKYVNTRSENKDARHKALINLMRTFIEYDEFNNAVAVADHLKKEKLSDDNRRNFNEVSAYLYQQRDDYGNMIRHLTRTILLSKPRERLARNHFIAGQVYQKFGYDSAAYANYNQCLKHNPIYEMSFYAKLNMAQVTRQAQGQSVKKVRKFFNKLLKDDKNIEYQDKIYYEMARFELNQDNYEQAIENYQKSVRSSVQNQRQKAYSYLGLGKLYYDHYNNYQLAKNYYDSVMTVMPADDEQFETVQQRQHILRDFVKQLTIIETQDSLLQLATMNTSELNNLLADVVAQQEKAKEEEAKARKKAARKSSFRIDEDAPFDALSSQEDGGVWYFYNPSAISSGMNEFRRRWGERRLEDDWRRSRKQQSENIEQLEELAETTDESQEQEEASPEEEVSTSDKIEQLKATIPFEQAERDTALAKIEEAYYKLGNIYNLQLKERQNAAQTFEKLLDRFEETPYRAEVLYQLYLIYQELNPDKAGRFKEELLAKFPETDYAKLIENPDYLKETELASQRLKKLYNIAYDYFDEGNYKEAELLVSRAITQYPDNPFNDHLKILDILITGKMEGEDQYKYQLQQFIDNNPESTLTSYAQDLLEASKNIKEREIRRKGAQYISDLEQEHFFIVAYQNIEQNNKQIPEAIDSLLTDYPDESLKTGNLNLNEQKALVLVNKFDNKEAAMDFYSAVNAPGSPLVQFSSEELNTFVITKDNFQILFQTKDLLSYLSFFEKYYSDTP